MKETPRALAFTLALILAETPAAAQHLVINELDYDQPSTDTNEFIEIYNPGTAPRDLGGCILYFVNGANSTVYSTIRLAAAGILPAGGYLVVKSSSVTADAGALTLPFPQDRDQVQNGAPDGVALVDTVTLTLLDALSYEGSVTSAQLPWIGTVSLVEGTATGAVDAGAVGSLARIPNGKDTDNASADWQFTSTVTPGAANISTGTAIDPFREAGGNQLGQFVLYQNHPNPFNSTTIFRYELPAVSTVRLSVFDINGREIAILANGKELAGVHAVTFDASTMASGAYFIRIVAGDFVGTRKMELIK
jgi:hypothetical protein